MNCIVCNKLLSYTDNKTCEKCIDYIGEKWFVVSVMIFTWERTERDT